MQDTVEFHISTLKTALLSPKFSDFSGTTSFVTQAVYQDKYNVAPSYLHLYAGFQWREENKNTLG